MVDLPMNDNTVIPLSIIPEAIIRISPEESIGDMDTVSGTFQFDSTKKGTAQNINLNYSGSGFPISVIIFPSEGARNEDGEYAPLVHQGAIGIYVACKRYITGDNAIPSYNGTLASRNMAYVFALTKASSSSANSYMTTTSTDNGFFSGRNASGTSAVPCVMLKNNYTLSVFIADTSYGFADGVEYKYVVLYSE